MKKGDMHPLRIVRCQRNLTIVELAEEAKVGASTIWRAEHDYSINAESRRRLCAYFDMEPDELGLLGYSKQNLTFGQEPPTLYAFEEACPPVYVTEKMPDIQLLILSEGSDDQQFSMQHKQSGTDAIVETNNLATLLDAKQEYSDNSRQIPKEVYQVILEEPDIRKQTGSLKQKAVVANTPDKHAETIRFSEIASGLLEGREEKDCQCLHRIGTEQSEEFFSSFWSATIFS